MAKFLVECGFDALEQLVAIGRETYFETFRRMNSPETMSRYLDEAFNPSRIREELSNAHSRFFLLLADNHPAAYIKINFAEAQTDINDPEALELERIYVRRSYKGRGFGRFLIDSVLEIAASRGCRYLWLGVWEKNEGAIAFYRKMGFSVFGTHQFRMGEELQQDLLFRKIL